MNAPKHRAWVGCDGTLIDRDAGVQKTLGQVRSDADLLCLPALHHTAEFLVQEGRSLTCRNVMAQVLRALSDDSDLTRDDGAAMKLTGTSAARTHRTYSLSPRA